MMRRRSHDNMKESEEGESPRKKTKQEDPVVETKRSSKSSKAKVEEVE